MLCSQFVAAVAKTFNKYKKLSLGNAKSIGVAKILDWPKPQIICNGVIRNFRNEGLFIGKKILQNERLEARFCV